MATAAAAAATVQRERMKGKARIEKDGEIMEEKERKEEESDNYLFSHYFLYRFDRILVSFYRPCCL